MPVNEYSKADYLRALLNSRKQLIGQGGSMLNPSLSDGISGLAALDTSFNGVQPQAQPQPQQSKTSGENWFDGFMNNVLGFVDEIAAKFGAGFVNGWEGILDLGATAIGALGDATGWYNSQPFTDWAKQDIGATAAEWSKTAFGLGSWYNRIRNWDWDTEEWKDIGKGLLDLGQAAFFAKNDLGDAREISNKHYKANDEALQDMGGFGEFLGGAAHSIGFMLPSIMTGGAAAGASGAAAGTTAAQAAAKIGSLASLGLSAAGQGSQEALNEGASAGQALGYGAVSGAIEVASEVVVGKVLKGMGLGTNKILGVFGGNTSKTLSKTASKELTKNIIKTAFEEGTEEVFSALLEPVAKSIYKGTDAFKDSNGKFIYASMEYWVGAGGDFNQSVLGQFAAGAFTGGITGGISETKLYKNVGSEGYLTIKSYANMTEAAQKAVELEENGKINSREYKAAVEEWEKWRNDFTDRSEKLGKLSQSKLNEVAKLLGNPAALKEALEKDVQESKDTNVRKFIKDVTKEVNSTDGDDSLLGARMITARKSFEELQRITGTNVKLEYTAKDSHYSSKSNTVYLNKATLKTEGGKHLVHEYLGHAMAKALSPKAQAKIFEQINENKSNSRMIKEVQNEPKYKKYQTEEIIARYLGNTFEQENQGKGLFDQLTSLNSLVGNKTLFDHIIDVFSGVKNYKINDPIFNEYTKAINQFLKATSKNAKAKKIYALAEKKKNNEKLTKEEREFYDKYKEVIDAVASSKEEMAESYAKELITGKYTVGDNKKRLEVRKVAKGYEVVYPDDVVLDQKQSDKKGKDVYVGRTITEAEINGKLVKFDTTKNIQAYLDDIKAKKVEYEKAKKTAPINKPTSIEVQSAPTETEMKKADETPIKKKYHIHDGASIFVRDGNDVLKYEIKRNKETGFYKASIVNENTAEVTEKELSYKALQREIDSYTNVSKNREDVLPKKKVEDTKKKTVKKESKVAKNEKKSQKAETKPTAETKDGKEIKVDTKVKKSKTTANKIVDVDVEILSSKKVEIVKSDIIDEAPRRTAQDVKNEAELNNVRTYTKVEVENTVKNISTEILKMYKLFDTSAKVKYNSDGFAKVSQRVFELLNKKNVAPQEVASELENIFSNVKIESQNGKVLVTEDLSTLLGEDLMKNVDVTSIVRANLEELIKNGKEAKVHALKRIFKEVRKALKSQISSLRKTGDRLAVLVRRRDSLRKSVGRFAEITKREVSKSGFNVLLDPFERLHRRGIRFNTTDFVESLDKVLDIYEQQKWEADFPDLPFSEEIRERLVRLREQTKGGTLSGAVLMQDCLDTINLIKETMKKVETRYVTETIPASLSTIKSIERNRYGQSANVLSRFWRMYKRGFAPAYVVLEQILGGNSSASKKLVYDMQNAINKRTLYKGAYADKINIELKKLGIKKTFDTKKIFFRGHNLTVDQAMGLYISTHVKANFDAINEDGASFYDETHDRVIELAQKGGADVLKFEVENYLPEEYRKFADWLLTAMNGTVKAEYIDWFEKKYGSYQMRNEIGAIGNNSYWSLKRSYQKLNNITKAVSNPDAVFSHAIKRTNGGHNAVLITGALGTFNAYIDKLSREIYTKPVYEETLAILNAKVDGNNSVMDVLSKREGSGKDIQFLKETMASLLDVNQRKYSLLDQMVSAFSVAKLSLNIGSMAKQFASAFTSNIPISKTAKALVAKWSSEARGEYKTLVDELGGLKYREANKGVLKANADSAGKFTEKIAKVGMWGISKFDLFTVSTGVYSLMVIGQDQFDAKIGTQKNIDFVKQHWSEYELSQIGNGALSRNAVANSSDSLVRYLFGFLQGANRAALGSQIHKFGLWQRNKKVDIKVLETELARAEQRLNKAETAYNANQDDVNARNEYIEAKADVVDLQNRKSDYESFKIAGGKAIIPNMAAGLVAQGILVALVNALMKRIKGKKDWDEIDVAEEGLNFVMALGVNWVPLVNQVTSVLQGYDVTVPPVEIINKISEIVSGINNNNWKTAIRQIAILVGDLTGVPVETVYSYIYGALKTFDPAIAYEMRSVLYGTSIQSATKTMQTYAAKGNETKTASMVGLILNKYKTGSTTDEINKELARLYISGYSALPKTALSQYTSESGDVVKLTSAQIQQFNQIYSRSTKDVSNLLKITEYSSATSEEKAKAIKKIYDAYYAVAKAKVTGGQVEGKIAQILALTNGNIGLAKYILSLQKIAQIGETAKKTRKELVLQYINRLRGYTRAEKTLLMFLAGYSVSGTSASQLKGFLISKGASSKDLKQYL